MNIFKTRSHTKYLYNLIHAPPDLPPRVRAVYDYTAQDLDELSLWEGQVFDLVRERGYASWWQRDDMVCLDESGWWTVRVDGKEWFFPGAYVKKM